MPPMTTVRRRQIWQDNDKRATGRKVRVVEVDATHATVELVDRRGRPARGHEDRQLAQPGRRTRIRLDRFRPTSTGYRLVKDAPVNDPEGKRPMTMYTWEFQRLRYGLWSHQHILGEPEDPRGAERSDLSPDEFARHIADRHQLEGRWKLVVWDTVGVGRPPVAVLDSDPQR